MDLVRRGALVSCRVALLPAAWNPPTRAHLALAQAALRHADEVLLTLPRALPHKRFDHAGFELRMDWLRRIAASRPGWGVAAADGGLFLDLARAARAADANIEQVSIVCGADAAERFLNWRYESGPGATEQLREFSLLVAPRKEPFHVPRGLHESIRLLEIDGELQRISSTEIRRRIRTGEPWEHLTPEEIGEEARGVYR